MAPLACLRTGACVFFLVSLLVLCEGCKKVTFNVPSRLEALTLIGRVNVQQCLRIADHVSSSDPDFVVLEDGSVYTTNAISLPSEGKTFTILLKNVQERKQKKIHVVLLSQPKKAHQMGEAVLRRSKRRWAPVPTTIMENALGPFPMQIQQLFSDTAQKYNITYSISGPGVDQPPLNYFYIEKETGNLFVTCPIDREEYSEFKIICYARTLDGYTPEIPLVHIIRIEDDNDNPPIFDPLTYTFNILENSRAGTLIGQVTATDRDEPGTLHTKLKYRITNYQPLPSYGANLFNINGDTGSITLAVPGLDRETTSEYTVYVEARDMAGQRFGLCNTATVVIQVDDANDHAPMCEHGTYEAYVAENTVGAEVANIGVVDRDAPGTPNWHAAFSIIKGNEDGAFKIVKKPDSNVGTLCIEKGLDYEKAKERRLEIAVNNEAPYAPAPNSRAISTSTCYVIVKVQDVDEGPVFDPCVYILNIKECLPAGTLVGQYLARDPETRNSEGIRYGVLNDPCNWITFDNMGEIRTTRVIDRDAPDLQLDQCNVTVVATDQSGKTGTGVVVVNLIDENDNFPVIVQKEYTMCRDREPVCLTAVDADLYPHTVPFRFEIPEQMLSGWRITQHDESSVYLEPIGRIPFGVYNIPVRVTDNADHGGITEIKVRVCDCVTPSDCTMPLQPPRAVPYPAPGANVTLGIWGILALILGSLLLLLILITLCGCCGTRSVSGKQVCDDLANQSLIKSNTEGPGAYGMETMIPPVKTQNVVTCGQMADMNAGGIKTGGQECFEMTNGDRQQNMESVQQEGHYISKLGQDVGQYTLGSRKAYRQSMMDLYRCSYSEWQNFTLPRLTEKVYLCGLDEENKYPEDYVISYNYEGRGSPAGSVGCCSDQADVEEADFLDQLDLKFRTLATICTKEISVLGPCGKPLPSSAGPLF